MKKIAKFFIFCFIITAMPVQAEITLNDLQIAVRALGFINRPPTGELSVGIVYAPNVPRSAEEALALQNMLGDGLQVGNLFLKPVMVKIDEADNTNVGLFFLTDGVGNEASKVLAASVRKQVLCVTTDIAQVKNGECALGIRSQPVEILVNRAVATNSGTTFATAFRMMITEY